MDQVLLSSALPYIRAYKGQCFVVKLGGTLCEAGPGLDHIAEQLSVLHQLGMQLVVVHGGGTQATELAEKLGVTSDFVEGRRVTSAEMLEVAKMVFGGTANTDLVAAFRKEALPAVGLTGVDAGLITAKRRAERKMKDGGTGDIRTVDYGFVGDIVSTDVRILNHLVAGGYVPVVGCIASDDQGQVLNINADVLASRIAQDMRSLKYIILTTVDGVMDDVNDPSTLHSVLDIARAESLMATGVIRGGMLPKITTSLEAVRNGVPRVHIVNGLSHEALLREIFTNEGSGTLIVASRSDDATPGMADGATPHEPPA
jgi:acetylglutamate kinase